MQSFSNEFQKDVHILSTKKYNTLYAWYTEERYETEYDIIIIANKNCVAGKTDKINVRRVSERL